jgi:hypothetical protein
VENVKSISYISMKRINQILGETAPLYTIIAYGEGGGEISRLILYFGIRRRRGLKMYQKINKITCCFYAD